MTSGPLFCLLISTTKFDQTFRKLSSKPLGGNRYNVGFNAQRHPKAWVRDGSDAWDRDTDSMGHTTRHYSRVFAPSSDHDREISHTAYSCCTRIESKSKIVRERELSLQCSRGFNRRRTRLAVFRSTESTALMLSWHHKHCRTTRCQQPDTSRRRHFVRGRKRTCFTLGTFTPRFHPTTPPPPTSPVADLIWGHCYYHSS